jgi:site-specific recombinase XerD
MIHQSQENALLEIKSKIDIAIRNAVYLWASATTSEGIRKEDLIRDKQQTVTNFFLFAGKNPSNVDPMDIEKWVASLRHRGLKPSTVYNRVCMISSFYSWAMRDSELGKYIRSNPARLARPKAPKAYQTENSKALSDEELETLVSVVRQKALAGNVVGKRDYAVLLFFMATGMRRSEIICLRGRDLKVAESIILTNRVKGGIYIGREISDPLVKDALIDYLTTSHRLAVLRTDAPLWTRHDFAGRPGAALSSHCFVKNMKRYAKQAGIDHFHIHQTRHTFARIVAEDTGSITVTQDALDHRNPSTTRVYVQRIAIKRDQHSRRVSSRWHRGDGTTPPDIKDNNTK